MAKINKDWVPNEVVKDVYEDDLTAYIATAELQIDALCLTQGNTATPNIPLDVDGYYASPVLKYLAILIMTKVICEGYKNSSSGNNDAYTEQLTDNFYNEVSKWENRVTYNSIKLDTEIASSSQAMSRSIPIGG